MSIHTFCKRLLRLTKSALLMSVLMVFCSALTQSRAPTLLEQVQREGVIEFLSSNGPDTIFEGTANRSGFEYALINRFAAHIGVKPTIGQPGDTDSILYQLTKKPRAIAAAAIEITPHRANKVRFGPSYLQASTLVIARAGAHPASQIADLVGHPILVKSMSIQAEYLQAQQKLLPNLQWDEADIDMQDLQEKVHTGKVEFALIDRATFEQNKALYSNAQIQFEVTPNNPIAWAFALGRDSSLLHAAEEFFRDIQNSGELARLQSDFFPKPIEPDADLTAFNQKAEIHLPKWTATLKKAAEVNNLDWTLLAAVGYQESHWEPLATSETGVRGFMMLTPITAKEVDVHNYLDPVQSIMGGAKYLRLLLDKLPDEIAPDDRLPMALVAYNIGGGHLDDAKRLAQKMGKNGNSWEDIKTVLPLLSRPSVYRATQFGYAPGLGAVLYVDNVLTYNALLVLREQEAERMLLANDNKASEPIEDMSPQLTDALKKLSANNSL